MELLTVLTDNLPKVKSRSVMFEVDEVEQIAKNIFYTMKKMKGMGLSAPQTNILLRIIAVDTTSMGGKFMGILINPVINPTANSKKCEFDELCLSFPHQSVRTKRDDIIQVRFQDFLGNLKLREFSGIDAIYIQHEVDHLDGITMFERQW